MRNLSKRTYSSPLSFIFFCPLWKLEKLPSELTPLRAQVYLYTFTAGTTECTLRAPPVVKNTKHFCNWLTDFSQGIVGRQLWISMVNYLVLSQFLLEEEPVSLHFEERLGILSNIKEEAKGIRDLNANFQFQGPWCTTKQNHLGHQEV